MRSSARKKKLWLRVSKCILYVDVFFLSRRKNSDKHFIMLLMPLHPLPRCIIIIFDYFSSPCGSALSPAFAKKTKRQWITQKGWSGSCPSWRWQWFQRWRWDRWREKKKSEWNSMWDEKKILNFRFFLSSSGLQMLRNITLTISGSALCSSSKVIYQSTRGCVVCANDRHWTGPTTSNLIQSQDERRSLWNWLSNALHISEWEPDINAQSSRRAVSLSRHIQCCQPAISWN